MLSFTNKYMFEKDLRESWGKEPKNYKCFSLASSYQRWQVINSMVYIRKGKGETSLMVLFLELLSKQKIQGVLVSNQK